MSQSAPLVLRLLASSVSVSVKAGKIIKDVMNKGELGIVEKSNSLFAKLIPSSLYSQIWLTKILAGSGKNDLQTEADRSAERCIIASLSEQFPGVTIIGEEGSCNSLNEVPSDWLVTASDEAVLTSKCPPQYVDTKPEEIVVWVDPLDGTSEYTQGLLDHVTVLIGIAVNGRAVAGVVHQPYYDYQKAADAPGRTAWGLVGLGVGGIKANAPPQDSLVITTTRSHNTQLVVEALEALAPQEVVRVGGAGHKALLVIEGKVHAYVYASKGCKKWDTCGPEAVLEAAGGKFTDLHGNHYSYAKDVAYPDAQGIFATANGVDHALLLSKIPQSLKDAFPY